MDNEPKILITAQGISTNIPNPTLVIGMLQSALIAFYLEADKKAKASGLVVPAGVPR